MSNSILLQNISRSLRSVKINKHILIWQKKYSCLKTNIHKSCTESIYSFQRFTYQPNQFNDLIIKIDRKNIHKSAFWHNDLVNSLTPEQETRLTQILTTNLSGDDSTNLKTSTRKKFKLKAIVNEIQYLQKRGFPLPSELKDEHWHDLLCFDHRETRTYYLDAMVSGTLNEEKKVQLYKDDQILSGPLIVPKDVEEEILKEGNVKKLKRLDEIKYTYESMLQNGYDVYPFMYETELIGLMEQENRGIIVKTIKFIYEKHMQRMSDFIEKRARQAKFYAFKEAHENKVKNNNHIQYGLGHNIIYLRKYPRDMRKVEQYKCIREFHEWGQPLVIDLSFIKNMSMQQAKSLFYREVNFSFKFNEESREPFVIYLTNFDPKCPKCSLFRKATRTSSEDDFPVVVTQKSYLDLFPQQNLLYLTPDSKNDLIHYNANDVYIIGGIVDDAGSSLYKNPRSVPYTLSAAKKEGIRHARLPMKRTLGISNELNVDHCVAIMADFKYSKDWFYSFRWVPPRIYRNRLKSQEGFTPRMEAVYLAHKQLHPMTNDSKIEKYGEESENELSTYKTLTMHANEYRERYKEIVEDWIRNAETDERGMVVPYDKYMWHSRDKHREVTANMMALAD